MTAISAIIFDVGGTLYNNPRFDKQYPLQVYRMLAEDNGITVEEAEQLFKETKKKVEVKTDKHVTKVRVMAELGYTRSQVHEAFCRNNPSDFLKPNPDLNSLLEKLSRRYLLGIVSNFRTTHTRDILKALGLNELLFSVIIGEDIVKEIKPSIEPFLKAVGALGVEPDSTLYVSDSVTKDLKPAKKVGMKTVLVGSLGDESGCVDFVVRNLTELGGISLDDVSQVL
jgi:putative hydrolase of the HAD superfamily